MGTDLLSADDWLDIELAIQDVTATFHKKPVTLMQRSGYSVQTEGRQTSSGLDLFGLFVPRDTDDDAEADQRSSGSVDDSQGYVNFDFVHLVENGVVTVTGSAPNRQAVFSIVPNQDTLVIDGEERDIIAVNFLGPNQDVFHLVKVTYKNRIAPLKD